MYALVDWLGALGCLRLLLCGREGGGRGFEGPRSSRGAGG